jgi:prepilin-type N-terminal cleavage/methylation domain-containing protein
MKKRILIHRKGFTLLEVMFTVSIIGVLSGLAIWQASSMLPQMRTKAAAREFAKNVDFCRMLALRTNRETRICLEEYDSTPATLSADNAGKYTMSIGDKNLQSDTWDILPEDTFEDSNDDDKSTGTIDLAPGSENHRRFVSIDDWGQGDIAGPNYGNDDCIVFSPRGFVLNPAPDFNEYGYIEVVFVNKVARKNSEEGDFIVMVSRSGMHRMDTSIARVNGVLFSGVGYDAANTDEVNY